MNPAGRSPRTILRGVAARRRLRKSMSSHAPVPYQDQIEYAEHEADISIGVVVPFDFELDWEYWRYLPHGVSLHFTRTPYHNAPVDMHLARQLAKPAMIGRAATTLASLKPESTLYACSSGSFVNGLSGESEIRRQMLRAGVLRPVTTSGAMLDALRAAGVRRVAVAAPYTHQLTERLVWFLREAGLEVPSAHYLGLTRDIFNVSKSTIAGLVRQSAHPEADAVFVSCTSVRTYGIVAQLEEEIDCPVFTSNQVSLWAALRAAGVLSARLREHDPAWVLGGGDPVARSTSLLMEAAVTDRGAA
jgi:maleate isomerase